MNYGAWALLLPAIEVGVLLFLLKTINARRYPAMLAYLAVEAAVTSLAALGAGIWLVTWAPLQPLRMALRFLLVCEVFRISCHGYDRKFTLHAFGWTLGVSAVVGAAVVDVAGDLSALQTFAVFRQFFSMVLASQVGTLALYTWRGGLINTPCFAFRGVLRGFSGQSRGKLPGNSWGGVK